MTTTELAKQQELVLLLDGYLETQQELLDSLAVSLENYRRLLLKQVKKSGYGYEEKDDTFDE